MHIVGTDVKRISALVVGSRLREIVDRALAEPNVLAGNAAASKDPAALLPSTVLHPSASKDMGNVMLITRHLDPQL